MARVVYAPLAEQDVRNIAAYLVEHSQSLTVGFRFLDAIEYRCSQYASQPELGERCADLGRAVRRFTVGNYVVFYRAAQTGIEVLRVLHGSRDVPTAFRQRLR